MVHESKLTDDQMVWMDTSVCVVPHGLVDADPSRLSREQVRLVARNRVPRAGKLSILSDPVHHEDEDAHVICLLRQSGTGIAISWLTMRFQKSRY